MERPDIEAGTLAAVAAFVLLFVVFDVLSTLMVIQHYGYWICAYEINVFLHLAGVSGLASVKLGLMMFFLGAIVVFSRHQAAIDHLLVGLAAAGAICGASNLCLLYYGFIPGIGPVDADYLAGAVVAVSAMRAIAATELFGRLLAAGHKKA
jgi:hypothetical protein